MNAREKFQETFATLPTPDLSGNAPVSQQVSDFLSAQILNGQIPPGTALSENNLCTFFNSSRQPVREALLRLSVSGLVQVFSQRGSVVSLISIADVKRAQFIREVIEAETVKRAITNATPAFLDALSTELELQETFISHADTNRFYTSDEAFHRLIARQSGIPRLWSELTTLKAQLDRVRHLQLRQDHALDVLIAQHKKILAAIEAGDAVVAENAMKVHLRRVLEVLDETVQAVPHCFTD